MNTSIDFAHCLKYLLSALGVSINRLSKALNVDGSLVNRWVNGKRIPSYDSNYIEAITQFLSANIKNSLQIQLINELFERVFGVDAETDCIEIKIKKVLFEAQGISLSNHKLHTKEAKKLLKYKKSMANPPFFNEVGSMSHDDKIISGTPNVAAAFRHLLGLALQTHKRRKAIYITYFNDVFFYMSGEDERRQFQTMLMDLMAQGCEIHYLLRITHDLQRMMDLLNFFKPLLGRNQLYLYYLKSYDSLTLGKDYFIVPETGVLSCFVAQADKSCALYLRNPLAISFYEEYWLGLTQSSATPLLIHYPADKEESFRNSLLESEAAIGNRFLFKNSFSIFTLPLQLYKKLLLKRNLSSQEMASALAFHQKCLEAFQTNIKIYEYKDIYTMDSLHYLVKNRQFYLWDPAGLYAVDLEREELVDFLQHLITLLKTYDHYSMAFVRKNTHLPGLGKNVSCVLKARHALIVEILGPAGTEPVRFSINEPMVLNSAEASFQKLWQQIAPVMKKKVEVIAWLQQESDLLKSAFCPNPDSQ